jgi:hypothetical protein
MKVTQVYYTPAWPQYPLEDEGKWPDLGDYTENPDQYIQAFREVTKTLN